MVEGFGVATRLAPSWSLAQSSVSQMMGQYHWCPGDDLVDLEHGKK